MNDVSLVITSCGRFDLLERTLDSFFEYNIYPIKKVIITEDSTEGKKLEKLVSKYKDQNFKLIINETREGQLKSIDKAYNEVDTEYVFHCEDDWEFLKEGFIEKSIDRKSTRLNSSHQTISYAVFCLKKKKKKKK